MHFGSNNSPLCPKTLPLLSAFLFFLTLNISGCYSKATGPYFEPLPSIDGGKALIYFYQPHIRMGAHSPSSQIVYADGKALGLLDDGGYFAYAAEPGRYSFSFKKTNDEALVLNLEAGKTYFIRWHFRLVSGYKSFSYHPFLVTVAEPV